MTSVFCHQDLQKEKPMVEYCFRSQFLVFDLTLLESNAFDKGNPPNKRLVALDRPQST